MPRIVGKAGSLLLNISGSWNFVADIYNWELSYEMVTLDASIKGDGAQRLTVSHGQGRLSAKRYVEVGGAFALGDLITSGLRYDWAVVALDTAPPSPAGFTTNTGAKAQGTGYFVRAQMSAPRGMVQDDMEMALDTLPIIN
jgi:hypothetical protein